MDKYQNKYRIQTARAVWHDYDGGAYFVTICTAGRAYYFGEIRNGEMILSGIGKIAEAVFTNVSEYYPYAEIPLFVIMPNHVHAIVFIDDYCRDHAAKHCMETIVDVNVNTIMDTIMETIMDTIMNTIVETRLIASLRGQWGQWGRRNGRWNTR